MARSDARRKGLRRAVRYAALLAVAGLLALPISFVTGMLMMPLLWRLEPVIGVELAGHSGPSDWILEVVFVVVTALLFGIAVVLTRPHRAVVHADDDRVASRREAAS